MDLTPAEISLIRRSHDLLRPDRGRFSRGFYNDLFRRNPNIRWHFTRDIDTQCMEFTAAVDAIVASLDDGAALGSRIDALVASHAAIPITPTLAAQVVDALVGTIGRAMPPGCFTSQTEAAWRNALGQICAAMIDAERAPAAGDCAGCPGTAGSGAGISSAGISRTSGGRRALR